MTPALSQYGRYLAAKRSVDDRALNAGVLEWLGRELARIDDAPVRVLEVGAGLGTMPARLIERGLLRRAQYTMLDLDTLLLEESRAWLTRWASEHGLGAAASDDGLQLGDGGERAISVRYRTAELAAYLEHAAGQYDLVIANALLDLVDVGTLLPKLLRLLTPRGLYWFSINFDGETVLLPELADDAAFLAAYHRSMDTRQRNGAPAGDSKSGRHLFTHLSQAGARIARAGSSDWVVFAQDGRYPASEAEFLQHIIRTIDEELRQHRALDGAALARWVEARQAQIASGELVYIAHQLDFAGSRA